MTAVDETGRIFNDCIEMLRNVHGRTAKTPVEIIEAMRDGMKMARKRDVELKEATEAKQEDVIQFPNGKTVKKFGTAAAPKTAVRKDDFKNIVHPSGSTVGLGGSYEIGHEAGYASVGVYGLRALAAVTAVDVGQREECFSHKGHRITRTVMIQHPDNRHVGRYGCLCIANMCSKATQSTLAQVGCIKEVVRRLEVNVDCVEVCEAAIMALWKLSEGKRE